MPNDQPKIVEGELLARDLRFALIAARFNDFVVNRWFEALWMRSNAMG